MKNGLIGTTTSKRRRKKLFTVRKVYCNNRMVPCVDYNGTFLGRQWCWCLGSDCYGREFILIQIGSFVVFSYQPGYLTILGLSTWVE